jgi:hypothetical protein
MWLFDFPYTTFMGGIFGEYRHSELIGVADTKSTTTRATVKMEFHITVISMPIVDPSHWIDKVNHGCMSHASIRRKLRKFKHVT